MTAVSLPMRSIVSNAGRLAPALFMMLGWLALYLPLYLDFAEGAWRRDENAHAPIILAICIAFFAIGAKALNRDKPVSTVDGIAGAITLALGFLAYAAGRIAEIDLFASASQVFVATGCLIFLTGLAGARRLWFPLVLMLYLIIFPGWMIDAATGPLKLWISATVSDMLYAAGLPVTHTGAVISAGPYELLVAQACSGVNSLIALTSVGAIYLYFARRKSIAVNVLVALSLVPIAIAANVARVLLLVLITYYGGYDAGQGFMHHAAGLFMFGLAIGGVFLVDQTCATLKGRR